MTQGHNVQSFEQKGGVTAGEVNVGSGGSSEPPKPKRSLWKWIVGAVAFLAGVVTVLSYFKILP